MILAAVAALASWAQVAPTEQAAMARTPDSVVQLAYAQGGQLFYSRPGASFVAPIGLGPDVRPTLLADGGGLRLVTGGVSATSLDGASWQVGTNGASGEVSASGDLLAWADTSVHVGASSYGPGSAPVVASGYAAWSVGEAVRVQPVNADGSPSGEAVTMPDGTGRPSLVVRGGEAFVAAGPALWRVGSSTTLALEDAVSSSVAADARGRVWATWTDGARVFAARSNRDVSELGASVDLGALAATRVQVSATNTAAHVLAAANGVSYLKRTLPGLTLDERHRREIFTFSVTDAGDPVRGAVVKVGGRSGKTDRNGRVTLRVSDRRLRVTATLKGYSNARLTLK
ncbi:hypothetical protein OJ997_25710 [Solirubrobacter phytolaccae]|uniref:Uncharacterized protein n=1 Tax=Solirubrobacter phytolaccae TaxID=1404360 RepID=A0A9X3NGN8_9ACTN|nr:hypothetical protein [Solirubrobacter phytolaccae]MDA0183731.1 hypothetical protein [Solirubrobacter phytolaccae]